MRAVAGVLAANLRDVDLVARLGGDEFGVLLPGAGLNTATLVAHRMVEAVGALEDNATTASIGVACSPTSSVLTTWHEADSAMYVAKRAGGNRVHAHVPTP
jgi:diguanylate cyclase (GGDEF)-like protein